MPASDALSAVLAVQRLMNPRCVAIVGASGDADKTSGRPIDYLRKHGFRGEIFPVNPRYGAIGDLACYPDVASLPGTPDVGLVLLGPDRAEDSVRELAARGTPVCVVIASGYAEAGERGDERQRRLKEAAGAMRLLGPNTIGLVNVTDGFTLSASGALEIEAFVPGCIGLISQSGGILGSLLSRAADCGIGYSRLISTGNEADLDVCDCLEYLIADPATRVITLYLEGLRSPGRFRELAARALKHRKPVVAYKVGRSEAGIQAAVSHTGAMAGSDRIYAALFRQSGVIRAQRFSDLIDIPAALATDRSLRGRRVAILTSTGGAGTLVADSCGMLGFDMPAPDEDTVRTLQAAQPNEFVELGRNPIDVTLAGVQPEFLKHVVRTLLASASYDALIVVVGSSSLRHPHRVGEAIAGCLAGSDKPVLAYVSPSARHVLHALNQQSIPAFSAPEACAEVLSALWRTEEIRRQGATDRESSPATACATDPDISSLPAGTLDEVQSKQLFTAFGIPSVREAIAGSPEEAARLSREFGASVVLKVLSSRVAHKSDVGGVRVDVRQEDVARSAQALLEEVERRSGIVPEHLLVQERVTGGIEILVGFQRDPCLGPTIVIGAGGVLTELMSDAAAALLPIERADALDMLAELKVSRLLHGVRGRPASDIDALLAAVARFAAMVQALGERLVEAEINPLFVLPAPRGVRAADGLVVLR